MCGSVVAGREASTPSMKKRKAKAGAAEQIGLFDEQ